MQNKVIELACSHNHGRSPLAEAFWNRELKRIGARHYRAFSSGTRVKEIDAILEGKVLPGFDEALSAVKIGLERGVLGLDDKALANAVVKSGKLDPVHEKEFYEMVKKLAINFV